MEKAPKIENLIDVIRKAIGDGRYLVSRHAWERIVDREIPLPDVKNVLSTGYHEPKKDQWSHEFNTWKYSIKGRTLSKANARIVVAIDSTVGELIVIITVINLDNGDQT